MFDEAGTRTGTHYFLFLLRRYYLFEKQVWKFIDMFKRFLIKHLVFWGKGSERNSHYFNNTLNLFGIAGTGKNTSLS